LILVSVIIINYNTFNLTVKCIKSVIEKTTIPYEIIVVDNASPKDDPQQFKVLFPNIKVITNSLNTGFSAGNNLGIAAASGDYILLLNSDTELINNTIDLAVNKIKTDSAIGALSVQLIGNDGILQQCSHYWSELSKLFACTIKLHHLFNRFKPRQPDLTVEHYAEYLTGTFFLFPKETLKIFKANKLPETFFMYGEDTQWSHYIRKAGYKLYYYPGAKILHQGGASSNNTFNSGLKNFANQYKLHLIIKGKPYTISYYLVL
jgi:GT2 family glycosyltransferase